MKDHVYSGAVGCVVCMVLFVLKACGVGEKYEDLGGGYMLVNEGAGGRFITGEIPPNGVVPPNVISCEWDGNFIVVKQCPSGSDVGKDMLERYDRGLDSMYYWLVVKHDAKCYGPMGYSDYVWLRGVYSVPESLVL